MNMTNCEDILMAAMAAADGEDAGLSLEQIEMHLAGCESCRLETERGESLSRLLENFERREMQADLWPAISGRLETHPARGAGWGWHIFAAFAGMLVLYKLVEMLPKTAPGYLLKIAPIAIAAALFILLRENPFKINTELITE
jgi:hypothetical protein